MQATYPVRPLALFLKPVQGESFVSYLHRLAYYHEVPLLTLLARIGLIPAEQVKMLSTGYGIMLAENHLAAVTKATHLDRSQVQDMLMTAFDGIAIDMSGVRPEDNDTFRSCALSEWVYFSGSHVCPLCIKENDGAWQLAWKLPWSFACVRHKVLLVDTCPQCNIRLGQGRRDGTTKPCFASLLLNPKNCANALPKGLAQPGRSGSPCGQPLNEIPTEQLLRYPQLLEAQHAIDNALKGGTTQVAGNTVPVKKFFDGLRSLSALILFAATPEDLSDLPKVLRNAFAQYTAERDHKKAVRQVYASHLNGPRTRAYVGVPKSAAIMATVTPVAWQIISSVSQNEMVKRMQWLVDRAREKIPGNTWVIPDYFRFSDVLLRAFAECMAPKKFARQIGKRSILNQSGGGEYTFTPDEVPQLLWPDIFEKEFASLMPNINRNNAQRFCSMALVKLCGDYTWHDTAEALGLPVGQGHGMANRVMGILNQTGNAKKFGAHLHALALQLSQRKNRVNYGERRLRFADFTNIPETDWLAICQQASILPGLPNGRSRYAAAWVWSEITGGDWTLAPGLQDGNITNLREVYRSQFLKNVLPKIEDFLRKYAEKIACNA